MRWKLGISSLVAAVVVAAPLAAQFGHPLKGTWSGDWGPNESNRNRILLEFDWVGCAENNCRIVGTLNPGPDAAPLRNITLTPPDPFPGVVANADKPWTLRFEADVKDEKGNVVRVTVDGKLDNLGAYRRRIHGNWTQGTVKGTFLAIRN